jgi:hypothetical protein
MALTARRLFLVHRLRLGENLVRIIASRFSRS